MNNVKNSIGWAAYTWNPIVGCSNNCYYCYAKELNNRFKFIPDFAKPQFFPERLNEPSKLKKPSTIFVGSMCDIFDVGVKTQWINEVIEICQQSPQHKFMFLTKKPIYYRNWMFPKNCWLGATCTRVTDFYQIMNPNKKFLSIEPIRGYFTGADLSCYDLVIIGAMTGKHATKTPKAWIESVKHHNIFYKDSAKRILEEV